MAAPIRDTGIRKPESVQKKGVFGTPNWDWMIMMTEKTALMAEATFELFKTEVDLLRRQNEMLEAQGGSLRKLVEIKEREE
jgi:hypothetical protein